MCLCLCLCSQIRVSVRWEVTDGVSDSMQCRNVGQSIPTSPPYSCATADVFKPNVTAYTQAKSRTMWAANYLQQYIYVNPVQVCPIVLMARWRAEFGRGVMNVVAWSFRTPLTCLVYNRRILTCLHQSATPTW